MSDDLSLTRDVFTTGSNAWMADPWPPSDAQPETLDADLVLATFTDGRILSGTLIGKVTATGRVGPYGGTTDEVQSVTVGGSGLTSFTLTYSGQTTTSLVAAATAAQVQAALEALSNIAVGDVVVTGPAGGPWIVTFAGAQADTNVAQMTSTPTGGSGTVTVATTTAGGADGTSDGRQVAIGHLIGDKLIGGAGLHVPCALYYRGRVFEDRLPAGSLIDAAAKADLTLIRYDRLGA